jgi:hypothetical protein
MALNTFGALYQSDSDDGDKSNTDESYQYEHEDKYEAMIPEEFMSYVYVGDESMEQNFQHWRQTKK